MLEYKKDKLLVVVPVVNGNPLVWWKRNRILYHNLAALARKYLAIQATSASSERIFSRASLIISNLRTRLDQKMAGKIFYVSENLNWYDEFRDTNELNSDDENN